MICSCIVFHEGKWRHSLNSILYGACPITVNELQAICRMKRLGSKKVPERKPYQLKDWREHPEDYILIRNVYFDASGKERIHHLIVETKLKISHIIEDYQINEALAQEMIQAGVRVVTQEEANRIQYPKLFGPSS